MSLLFHSSHAYPRHQLSDVANGLCYLHSRNVIHGGIKGVCDCSGYCFTTVLIPCQLNILVDDSGHGCIADFGSATVAADLDSEESESDQLGHTPRWAAPESLNDGTYSKEADVFSFAMVMIEVRNGRSTTYEPSVYCRCIGFHRRDSVQ